MLGKLLGESAPTGTFRIYRHPSFPRNTANCHPTVTRLRSLGALKIRCPQGRVGSSPTSGILKERSGLQTADGVGRSDVTTPESSRRTVIVDLPHSAA